MDKKYELIPSDKEGLFRVKALGDFNDVKKGDIGGYVEGEKNLSQLGDCWIYDDAVVMGNAKVCYKAKVCDNARVWGNAQIWGSAVIYGNAYVFGNARVLYEAKICDNAKVCGDAHVYDNAKVCGDAVVRGNAVVCCKTRVEDNAVVWNNAQIYGYAKVCDNAQIYGNAYLHGNAIVRGNAKVYGDTEVSGNAQIWGNAEVSGDADVSGDAIISSNKDYIVFKNWWSSGRYFTWTRSNNMWKVGCFYGTGEELIAKAYKDSAESGTEYENIVRYAEGENKHYTQSLEKTWKPTQKQLDAIELAKTFVTDDFGENPTLTDTLNELLEQLKKLTGEDI